MSRFFPYEVPEDNLCRQPTAITGLLEWLRGKLAEAERAVAAREQSAAAWRTGSDEEWAQAARMHPSTASAPPITPAVRMKNAKREQRIAEKCRLDVENFKAVLSILSHTK